MASTGFVPHSVARERRDRDVRGLGAFPESSLEACRPWWGGSPVWREPQQPGEQKEIWMKLKGKVGVEQSGVFVKCDPTWEHT